MESIPEAGPVAVHESWASMRTDTAYHAVLLNAPRSAKSKTPPKPPNTPTSSNKKPTSLAGTASSATSASSPSVHPARTSYRQRWRPSSRLRAETKAVPLVKGAKGMLRKLTLTGVGTITGAVTASAMGSPAIGAVTGAVGSAAVNLAETLRKSERATESRRKDVLSANCIVEHRGLESRAAHAFPLVGLFGLLGPRYSKARRAFS